MKRHGNLWPELTSFHNLLQAARNAARGKRSLANVARFGFDLERQLVQLQDELVSYTYQPGAYRTFEIFEPKRRMISAAPFRDRVIHHALCSILESIFERTFIHDSYACRQGKGTHAAVDRFQHFAGRWVRPMIAARTGRFTDRSGVLWCSPPRRPVSVATMRLAKGWLPPRGLVGSPNALAAACCAREFKISGAPSELENWVRS